MTVNLPGIHDEHEQPTRTAAEWLWALLPIGLSIFCVSALGYYHLYHDRLEVASALQVAIAALYRTFGFAPSCMFFLLLLMWSSLWFHAGKIDRPTSRIARLFAMAVLLGVFMNLGDGTVSPAFHKGELGRWLAERLVGAFTYYPSLVLVFVATLGSLLLATDYFFADRFEALRSRPEAPDSGVETAVTDHLKGLAGAAAGAAGSPAEASFVAAGPAVEPASGGSAGGFEAVADDEVEVEPLVDSPIDEVPTRSRRQSYFERRFERELPPAAGGVPESRAEDAWVPTGPDAQEIPDPEAEVLAAPARATGPAPQPVEEPPAEPAPVVAAPTHQSTLPFAASVVDPVAESAMESPEPSLPPATIEPLPLVEPVAPLAEFPAAAGSPDPASASDHVVDAAASEPPAPDAEPEPIVAIPRPEPVAEAAPRDAARQQSLFAPAVDEALVTEAIEVVTTWRRASATFLQRKLRIDYDLACRVLAELATRRVVELEADSTHGRVLL